MYVCCNPLKYVDLTFACKWIILIIWKVTNSVPKISDSNKYRLLPIKLYNTGFKKSLLAHELLWLQVVLLNVDALNCLKSGGPKKLCYLRVGLLMVGLLSVCWKWKRLHPSETWTAKTLHQFCADFQFYFCIWMDCRAGERHFANMVYRNFFSYLVWRSRYSSIFISSLGTK